MNYRLLCVSVGLTLTACGSSPTQPATVQVAGLWSGTSRLTAVSGGECVGAILQGAIGTAAAQSALSVSIQQTGSSLSATVTNQGDGSACTYSGTAGTGNIVLNLVSCQLGTLSLVCPNGAGRIMALNAGSLNASVTGSSLSGTTATTYNVTNSFGAGVAVMTVNGTFSANRQ